MKKLKIAIAVVATTIALSNCDNSLVGTEKAAYTDVTNQEMVEVVTPYTVEEIEGLTFMLEEEKMARDSYIVFGNTFTSKVFDNIQKSEQQHMDAVYALLSTYQLPLPQTLDEVGVFENADLQSLYNSLTDKGITSLTEALKTGAMIEEVDIVDLNNELAEVVVNQNVKLVFENLIKGSENHLRAFVKNLNSIGVAYTPSFLSQEEYDRILNS